MLAPFALSALVVVASAFVARAEVVPSDPGPGDVFNAGAVCNIAWDGDELSKTDWQDMRIQLMTGDNFEMVHITTVATGLDGTTTGTYEWKCPEVIPNSAIYFYQFTSPHIELKTWTTRFTIASSTGATTPPANPTQPGTNEAIAWGTGALADPSTAVAAPAPGTGAGSGNSTVSSSSTPSGSSTPSSAPPSALPSAPLSSSSSRIITSSHTGSAHPTASASSTGNATTDAATNAAAGSLIVDNRVWQSAVALGASAMAFTLLL